MLSLIAQISHRYLCKKVRSKLDFPLYVQNKYVPGTQGIFSNKKNDVLIAQLFLLTFPDVATVFNSDQASTTSSWSLGLNDRRRYFKCKW